MSIDREPDLDDVGAQLGRGDTVDRLIDECVDAIAEAPYYIRDDVRFHAHILPNICSPPPLRSTLTNAVRVRFSPFTAITSERHRRPRPMPRLRKALLTVDLDRLPDQGLQGSFVHGVAVMNVDGADGFAVQPRVEELLRIRYLGALRERQAHRILEHLTDAHNAIVRPNSNALRPRRLLPFDLFHDIGIGLLDERAQRCKSFCSPVAGLRKNRIDLLRRGLLYHEISPLFGWCQARRLGTSYAPVPSARTSSCA
jgi:hypothetical protein